jgi:hypothetical protein
MSYSLPSILQREQTDSITSASSDALRFPSRFARSEAVSGPAVSQRTGHSVWRTKHGLSIQSGTGSWGMYVPNGTTTISGIRVELGHNSDDQSKNDLLPEELLPKLKGLFGENPGDEVLQRKLGDLIDILKVAPSLFRFMEELMEAYVSKKHFDDEWTPRHTDLKKHIIALPWVQKLRSEKKASNKVIDPIVRCLIGCEALKSMHWDALEITLFQLLRLDLRMTDITNAST